jgi:hypothetical protein
VEGNAVALKKWMADNISAGDAKLLLVELELLMTTATTKLSGRVGNELDTDEDGQNLKVFKPTGVTKRKRANSRTSVLKDVKAAAAKQELRSFIRTWVRVMKGPAPKA